MPNFNTTGKPTFDLIKKLSDIRKDNIALRRGDITKLKDSSNAGIFAFGRGHTDQNIIVAINTSSRKITETITVDSYASDGDVLEDIFADSDGQVITVASNSIDVTIPAYGITIFRKQ